MARPDNQGEDPSPLAHHPVTRHDGRGPGRLPVARRLSRRSEARTPWEALVHQPCPDRPIPTTKQARARLQQDVEPMWLAEAALQKLPQPLQTHIALGMAWFAAALPHQVPLSVRVFDSGDLAAAVVAMARSRHQDWSSLRKQTRHLETHSCVRQEAAGTRLPLAGPPRAGEDLVPLLPPTASRAVTVGEQPSWPFPLAVRLPGLGKVRLVVSVKNAALTGTDAGLVNHRVDGKGATDPHPVSATLAKRDFVSGRSDLSGLGRGSQAQRCSHGTTLGSGVRGLCALASGLPSSGTAAEELPHHNQWGSVSSARAGAD